MNIPSLDDSSSRALNWAHENLNFTAFRPISEHPWATVFCLRGSKEVFFLKQNKTAVGKQPTHLMPISNKFPLQVPELLHQDLENGFFLFKNHEGQELGNSLNFTEKRDLLNVYGQMQATASQDLGFISELSTINTNNLIIRLLTFLDEKVSKSNKNTSFGIDFLDRQKVLNYHNFLTANKRLVEEYISTTKELDITLNHCDLRAKNVVLDKNGRMIIFDWDEAIAGPPGLSLHNLFGGCDRPYKALTHLESINDDQQKEDRTLLEAYIKVLSQKNEQKSIILKRLLPAVIVAGTVHYILSFANSHVKSSSLRATIGKNITRRLDSLLRLVELLRHGDRSRTKIENNTTEKLEPPFIDQDKSPITPREKIFSQIIKESESEKVFPAIQISKLEVNSGKLNEQNRLIGTELFKKHGALMIENALPPTILESCREHFIDEYEEYLENDKPEDSLRVGNKRFMVTVKFSGPFADPNLVGCPMLLPIIENLLGHNAILGSQTVVASLPGSENQRLHKDNDALFIEDPLLHLPSTAITVIFPLVNLDHEIGATRIIKGSHRFSSSQSKTMPHQDPVVKLGSCFLMDSRLTHRGMANKSQKIRPILSHVFQRPWYQDYQNFKKQLPIDITKDEYQKLPNNLKPLVSWAV